MPTLVKPHRPALVNREHFSLLAARGPDPEDPYYYRFDPEFNFGKTSPFGFQLPLQTLESTVDKESLTSVFETLPEGQAVYRLGWWVSWTHCAAWISCGQPHDKVVISRIRKEDLTSISGVRICEDRLLKNRAILAYTTEVLSDSNQKFSNLVLPFEKMEYLYTDFGWHSAQSVKAPKESAPQPRPEPIREADVPWALTLQFLAKASLELYDLIDHSSSGALQFGDAARAALQSAGVRCGSTDRLQMLKALAWVGGSWYHKPDPGRLSSDLLFVVCHECKRLGRPWAEGRAELERRVTLKGLHRLVWRLRDLGLVSMDLRQRVGDRKPMFP